jgi:Ca-activated chloride channel family protein
MLPLRKNRLILIIALLFIFLFTAPYYAYADKNTSGISAVMLLDSSGSMRRSDPNGVRFDAVRLFIDMCHIKGDSIGFAAYGDGIIKSYDLKTIENSSDKQALKNAILNIPFNDWTDIGGALKYGLYEIQKSNIQDDMPVIILFSDGKNAPKRSIDESQKDINDTILKLQQMKIPVYTVGLNYDGTVDKNQLTKIADETGGEVFITDNAQSLPLIWQEIFADKSKLKIINGGSFTAESIQHEFSMDVDNSNITEANISIVSGKPVTVNLIDPDGKHISLPSDNVYYSPSNNYTMIKLLKPAKGKYNLEVKGAVGDKITVDYIFNCDYEIESNLDKFAAAKKGDVFHVNAYLTKDGDRVDDEEVLKSCTAKLLIENMSTGEKNEIILDKTSNSFEGVYKVNTNDKLEAKILVDGKSFYRESQTAAKNKYTPPAHPVNAENTENNIKKSLLNENNLWLIGKAAAGLIALIIIIKIISLKEKDKQRKYKHARKGSDDIELSKTADKIEKNNSKAADNIKNNADTAEKIIVKNNETNFSNTDEINKTDNDNMEVESTAEADNDNREFEKPAETNNNEDKLYDNKTNGSTDVIEDMNVPEIKDAVRTKYSINKESGSLLCRIKIEIKDETTNEISPPVYKKVLISAKGIDVYELFLNSPEYSEIKKIRLYKGNEKNLILKNSSGCYIRKNNGSLDNKSDIMINQGDKISICLKKITKIVYIKAHVYKNHMDV